MRIDFTKVSDEETTFELLTEGKHVLKVTDVKEKVSQNTGNEYWAITLEDKEGNKLFENLVFTEKTLNRVKKMFKTLGLDVEGEFDYEPSDLIGCYMNAEVIIDNYIDKNGKDKQKNALDLWACEPYTTKKSKAKPKVEEEELDSIPF